MQKQSHAEGWLQNTNLFSRRSFLKGGALAVGAVAGSSVLTGCSSSEIPAGFKALKPLEINLYEKLMKVCLPTDGTNFVSPKVVSVIQNIDHLYSLIAPSIRSDLKAAASLFEYGATVIGFHLKPFSQLSDEEAKTYIDKWQAGATIQRGIAATLKKLIYLSYWREEATWAPLSYDGPVSVKWGLVPQGNSPLPE